MTDVDMKTQPDLIEAADFDPLASTWARYLAAIAMTGVATVAAIAVDSKVAIPNLSLVFVIPVIVAGLGLGLGPSLCAAVLGATAFNFFLTEPRYSLAVDDPSNIWAIALLFVVGLVVSGVAFTSRRRASEAARLQRQATILKNYSRDILAAKDEDTIASVAAKTLGALFGAPAAVMLVKDGKLSHPGKSSGVELAEPDLEAAHSSCATGTILRSGIYPNLASRFDFWPVGTSETRSAVVGLAFDPDERPASPDTHIAVVTSLLAFALDRRSLAAKW